MIRRTDRPSSICQDLAGFCIVLLHLGLSLAAWCAVGGVAGAVDWPQYAFDAAHTEASPESLAPGLVVRWVVSVPQTAPAWPDQSRMDFDECCHPLVVGRSVIVASPVDDSVAAYDLSDGRLRWRFFTGGPVRLPPASDGVRVFAGSDDGWLYALGVERGELLWKYKGAPQSRLVLGNGRLIDTWCVRGGPVVADGQVYFGAGIWPFMGVFLHCLDASTGKPVWTNSGEGAEYLVHPHGALSFGGIAPQGSLAVSGTHLLVPGGRTLPACYDRRTGKREHFVLATKTGDHRIAVAEKYFFCAGTAYDLMTGKAVGPAFDRPVIAGGELFGAAERAVAVANLADLTVDAKQPPAAAPAAPWSKLLPGRRVKAAISVKWPEIECLIKAGGRLYAGGKGSLAAFDLPLSSGRPPAWQVPVEGTVGAMAAGNGHLIAATDQGRIYCLGPGSVSSAATTEHPGVSLLPRKDAQAAGQRAEAILKDSGVSAGYALVLGAESGELARTLAEKSRLRVVVLERDETKVQSLRAALHAAGLYGDRVAVCLGDPATAPLPPYFAALVVADAAALPAGPDWRGRLFRLLHPYGGRAYLRLTPEQRQAIQRFASGSISGKVDLSDALGGVRLVRSGGLPGAGSWTHEHADAANTRVSSDRLVKAPLGLLWFGGSTHDGILPRHGHGPMPQVLDGRLVIEMTDGLRSLDIYTGRVLWEASLPGLGAYYNVTTHHFGANGAGTNYISTPEALYVRYFRECLRLDPATGKPLASILLPKEVGGEGRIWGYLNVADEYFIGGSAAPDTLHLLYKWVQVGRGSKPAERPRRGEPEGSAVAPAAPQAIESQSLFVMDRSSGKLLWSAAAQGRFRHNAVCAGGGRLYAIDRPPAGVRLFPDTTPSPSGRLTAFDLATGKPLWQRQEGVFGTWLSYSARHDVLIEAGFCTRDALRDEPRGMRAYRGSDGRELWYNPRAAGPAMIHGDWVLQDQAACGILDGRPVQVDDPITGQPRPWRWTRAYGCNTPIASEHLLTFRSGAAGFYDLSRLGGTGNWGGFRSSCTNNLIVAGGILTAADYTRTCTCSYQNQTSLALVPDAETEMWTYQGPAALPAGPVRRLGINFAAPGNRRDDSGTLWLEHPRVTDLPAKPSAAPPWPKVDVTPAATQVKYFRQHASVVSGPLPWVCASGAEGVESVRLTLADPASPARRYTVRLYFSEPEDLKPGDRTFGVLLQGHEVVANLDVVKESGAPRRGLVREFPGIEAAAELLVTFRPVGSRPAILSGIEVLAAP